MIFEGTAKKYKYETEPENMCEWIVFRIKKNIINIILIYYNLNSLINNCIYYLYLIQLYYDTFFK